MPENTEPKNARALLLDVIDAMLEKIAPGVIADTSVDDCRRILWFLGNEDLGQQPGQFDEALLCAASHADALNLAMLGRVYPHLAAFDVARSSERGMQLLVDRVREHEAAMAAAFDMPAPTEAD